MPRCSRRRWPAMLAQALAHRAMGGKVPVTFGQPG
jgi:hypothetical protein